MGVVNFKPSFTAMGLITFSDRGDSTSLVIKACSIKLVYTSRTKVASSDFSGEYEIGSGRKISLYICSAIDMSITILRRIPGMTLLFGNR